MPMPKSVTKVSKNGVTFTSNVDACSYTLKELEKAALRDSAKIIKKSMRVKVPIWLGVLKSNIASWVKRDRATGDVELLVGVYSRKASKKKGKKPAFHVHLLEFGTVKMKPQPFIKPGTFDNISQIREAQGKYLSYIGKIEDAKKVIDESEEVSDD